MVNGGGTIVSAAGEATHTRSCAMSTAGALKCWGLNTNGQLLNGDAANHISDSATEIGDNMPWLNH